jgi:hypothetical protein
MREPPMIRLRQATLIVAAGTAVALAFGLVAGVAFVATERSIDIPLYAWLVENHQPDSGWTAFTDAYTQIGDPLPMVVQVAVGTVLLCVVFGRRWWLPAVALPLALALEWGLQQSIAWIIDRGHPPLGTGTYPSGGSARFVVIYGLVLVLATVRWPAIPQRWRMAGAALVAGLSLFEAYTRLYLLKHWPTDVPAGLVIGAILLATLSAAVAIMAPGANQASASPPERLRSPPP